MDEATAYAQSVARGETLAGPLVRAACKRHLDDLRDGHKRGLVWRPDKAQHVIEFCRDVLRLSGTFEGVPFDPRPWQCFILGCLFGWYGIDGFRRFRVAYIETAKGNGKSPLVAAIGLYMMVADGQPRAEIYAAATHKPQAMILFRDAVAMVQQSPELEAILVRTPKTQGKCWHMADPYTGSWFEAISSENGKSGPRPHCSLVDELHEHKTSEIVDMLHAGLAKMQRSLIVEITNSGVDKQSICYQHHEQSKRIVEGTDINDAWFAFVCGLDVGDDPFTDETCWGKANPNLGVSIHAKELRQQVVEARGMPAKASKVRRLHFCQWVDAANPWIGQHLWLACEDQDVDPYTEWQGRECMGGLDLSGTSDLTALALVFPWEDGGGFDALVEYWTPKDSLTDRSNRDRVPYNVWVEQGHMTAPPGLSIDYAWVARRFAELQGLFTFRRCAFDPYRIADFTRELEDAGVEIELISHGQGFFRSAESGLWMPRSIEVTEGHIFANTLNVAFNPCLRHNVASAVTKADEKNNRVFAKRSAKGRIDGAVALTMAIGALVNAPADNESRYDTAGVRTT